MMTKTHTFVSWEEHNMCQERGSRVVHYYLKEEASGESVLAVIGTERSLRHMIYVVSEEFVEAYGANVYVNASTKWRARREVVDWLTSLVPRRYRLKISDSPTNETTQALPITGLGAQKTYLSDRMVPRKLKVQSSEIEWSGVASTCSKQLKHYSAFCRNGITISVLSFVFIMALEEHLYLGYVEDMYEDKKGRKKVRVRWFHHTQEVKDVIGHLNPHPREVFITPHVQVISAECVDGPATVLTPKHYEQCLAILAHNSSSGIRMCSRQLVNHKVVKSFSLAKLGGYYNQALLSSLDVQNVSKKKSKCDKVCDEDEEELAPEDPLKVNCKRNRSYKGNQGHSGVKDLVTGDHLPNPVPTYPKLKLKLSRKAIGVNSEPQHSMSFKVNQKIELLCQDSGIRGCWFRCKVLQTSQKLLKVQYDDVQDVDETSNVEEWVPAFRVAAPDKLGMRCSGRLRLRPCRPNDSTEPAIEVGVPVDAWWCDGWWEGVVTGVNASGTDTLQVYFPGEEKLMTFQRKDVRASRDWVENRWVDVKAKPNILLCISQNISSSMKLLTPFGSSSMKLLTPFGSSKAEVSCLKAHMSSKLKADEEKQEVPDSAPPDDDWGNAKRINLRKWPCTSNEYDHNCTDSDDGDVNLCNKDELILKEEVGSAYEKYETPEAARVATQG